MKNKQYNLNFMLRILLFLSFFSFVFTSCPDYHDFYIKNNSNADIKVILIDKHNTDTIQKLILEPSVKFNFYHDYDGYQYYPMDSIFPDYFLFITKENKPYNKNVYNKDFWVKKYIGNYTNEILLTVDNDDF